MRKSKRGLCLVLFILCGTTAPAAAQDEEIEQWVQGVLQTSADITSFNGGNFEIPGPANGTCDPADPSVYVGGEELVASGGAFGPGAWLSGTPDAGIEWIEVRFEQSVNPLAVEIYQTFNPGAITRVQVRDLDNQLQEVWSGEDTQRDCPAVLRIQFPPLDFPVNILRIEMDTSLIPGWNQIDAIKLIGVPARTDDPLFVPVNIEAPWLSPVFGSYTAADYDNDGWPDMLGFDGREIQHGLAVPLVLTHNHGDGTFGERGAILAREKIESTNGGRIFGDYDNDGDLDLYLPVGGFEDKGVDRLLRNDRGTFVDAAPAAGLTDSLSSMVAIWLDYDRDGFLDLYVGRASLQPENAVQNALYRNNGDGTFSETTAQAGLDIDWRRVEGSTLSGSDAGMIAADFDDDGWIDLYLPVAEGPNRLFRNDNGFFRDITTPETGILGATFGITAGDIDQDGDLDIFQASFFDGQNLFTETALPSRSALLLNLGDGNFVDALEGVGLGVLTATRNILQSHFFDFDNDGDLDLSADPFFFFANQGQGLYRESSLQAALRVTFSSGDFDGDGLLEIWSFGDLFRSTRGAENHYLRLDLVGIQSNRDGIGAAVFATAGGVRQRFDLLGGAGWFQDELMVHFGLGQSAAVEQLEIRWPSGQVDFINDIPADQEIRVIEGRGDWYPAPRTVWQTPPPAELAFGEIARFRAVVRPALFEPTAIITQITADLSGLGGPEEVPLEDLGDGTYAFDADFAVGGDALMRDVEVFILQETSLGEHWINLSRNITVNDDPFTAVLESYDSTTPESFSLNQNYPNPFNSGTVIPFALPTGGEVELTVFNLAGQKVATLVKGHREAGQYKITWDGRDDAGHRLATGIYLYRLRSRAGHNQAEQILTQKLLLLQ